MHLLERAAGVIEFVLDSDDSSEDQEFHAEIQKYRIMRQGASIFFYNANNEIVLHFNPFDNTVLVCNPDGYALAKWLGTKRFPIGDARLALTEQQIKDVGATKFKRDYSFSLQPLVPHKASPYKVVELEELLKIYTTTQLNAVLSELFNRCSDFTPGKKAEYLKGGKLEDKFCRFNLENQQVNTGIRSDQVFLLDDNNKIIGTISFTFYVSQNRIIDVYLYDEVVDYFTLLSEKEKLKLISLFPDDTMSAYAKDAALQAIALLIEPKRLALMEPLFAAARLQILDTINFVRGPQDDEVNANAFIRAAAGREELYLALNCSGTDSKNHVIHGAATRYANLLDNHVKQWAFRKLQQFSFHQYLEQNWSADAAVTNELKSGFDYRLFGVNASPLTQTTPAEERKISLSP